MTHLYFTGFDCLGCRAAYGPDQDLLLCPRCQQLLEARYDLARFDRILDLVEIPRDVVSGYEAMLAEAERI